MKTKLFLIAVGLISVSLSAQNSFPLGTAIEDYINAKWDSSNKSLHTYDQNGNLIMATYYSRNSFTGKWMPNYRYEYEYNSDNNRTGYIYLNYQAATQSWDSSSRFHQDFYDAKNRSRTEFQYYYNGWINVQLDSHFVDVFGNIFFTKTYWWDQVKEKYDYLGRNFYGYTSTNHLQSDQSEWLDTVNMNWDIISRYLYSYNISDLQDSVLQQGYDISLGYINQSLNLYEYDNKGIVQTNDYLEYNDVKLSWENKYRSEYSYHNDGRKDVSNYFRWSNSANKYNNYYRETYLYSKYLGTPEFVEDELMFYPNPVNDKLNIRFPSSYLGSRYELRSINGNEVSGDHIRNVDLSIDMSSAGQGLYLLVIYKGDERIIRQIVRE